MRIRSGYPRTRAGCKRLRKQADKLVMVDEFGEGVRAGLFDVKEVFRR